MKLNSAFDIIKLLIKRWDYQPLDLKFDLESYKTLAPEVKQTRLSKLRSEIQARESVYKKWDDFAFYFGCFNTAALLGVMILGMTQFNLPKAFTSTKKISLGPRTKITFGLLSMQTLAQQVIKYVVIYYKKPVDCAKRRERAFYQIDHDCILDLLKARGCRQKMVN